MQKWIYAMKPRKPFSMERKGSFNVIPLYSREFKVQPSEKSYQAYIGSAITIMFLLIALAGIRSFITFSNRLNQDVLEHRKSSDLYAFEFLIKSGKSRLEQGYYKAAASEFKLALDIFPNNKEVKTLYFQMLSLLCQEEQSYCMQLESLHFQ